MYYRKGFLAEGPTPFPHKPSRAPARAADPTTAALPTNLPKEPAWHVNLRTDRSRARRAAHRGDATAEQLARLRGHHGSTVPLRAECAPGTMPAKRGSEGRPQWRCPSCSRTLKKELGSMPPL